MSPRSIPRGRTAAARVALACLGLALAVPGVADAGTTWGAPAVQRAADGEQIQSQTVTYTSTGELLAVWNMGAGLRFAARPPGGRFGAAAVVDPDASWGRFAVDRQGGAFLGWTEGGRVSVAYRPAGQAFRAPERLGSGDGGLALAVGISGEAVVLFNRWEAGGRRLYTSFRPVGGTFGVAQPVSALIPEYSSDWDADVALAPDGRALYVWRQAEVAGGPPVVKGAVRSRLGSVEAPVTLSRAAGHSYGAQVASDARGNAIAVWVESLQRYAPGAVTVAHRPAGGPFGPPRDTGGSAGSPPFGAVDLAVSDFGETLIAYRSMVPLAGGGGQLRPSEVVAGNAATGALAAPRPVGREPAMAAGLVMNARGDALLWSSTYSITGEMYVEVARRAPAAAFGGLQAVRCSRGVSQVSAAALDPAGRGLVLSSQEYGGMEFSEDRPSSVDSPSCNPLIPNPPRTRRPPPVGTKRLSLVARIPRRGRLTQGRWIELIAQCNRPCRVNGTGSVTIAGRRGALRLASAGVALSRAGSKRVRVGLTRGAARPLAAALRRSRRARARIRLTATAAGAKSRSVSFSLNLRR